MDNALWTFRDVHLGRKGAERLREVSLDVRPGVTAVLGPSGAGKTSLLDLLVGYEKPDKGDCPLASLPLGTLPFAIPVYWVPQSCGLWPRVSAADHLRRVRPAISEEEVNALLEAFDLAGHAHAYPDTLSLGERSRLAVARAMAADAAVLVMDEPLANVNVMQASRYWKVIRRHLSERGRSLVFATHSPKTVLAEAERVICIADGRVIYDGGVDSLYQRPESPELAACLGEANWFEPDEAALWLGREPEKPLCLRPEHLAVTPAPSKAEGPFIVRESLFAGSIGELELEHEATGRRRRFFHRPSSNGLHAGARVVLKALIVLLVCLALGCEQDASGPALSVSEMHTWALPLNGPKVPAPRCLALGAGGDLLVLDDAGRVIVYDSAGKVKRSWWMPEYANGKPEAVLRLRDGRLTVADTHYNRVVCFDGEGTVLSMMGTKGEGPGQFIYPVALTQDDAGNLYVAEYGGNDRVQKFSPDGKFILAIGSCGAEPGQFQRPSGLVWHKGKLYVADAFNSRLQVFADDGRYLGNIDEGKPPLALEFPYGLCLGPDETLYIIEYSGGRLTRVGLDGALLGRFGGRSPCFTAVGDCPLFRTPWGIVVDAKRRIFVADTGNRRLVELIQ